MKPPRCPATPMNSAAGGEFSELAAAAGIGAAQALSTLLNDNTQIRGPRIYNLKSPDTLLLKIKSNPELIGVTRNVPGATAGKVSLAVSRERAPRLVDLLNGHRGCATQTLGRLELDAIRETGNIIFGAYLGLLGPAMGVVGIPSEPVLVEGLLSELLACFLPQEKSICVETRLLVQSNRIEMILLMASPIGRSAGRRSVRSGQGRTDGVAARSAMAAQAGGRS